MTDYETLRLEVEAGVAVVTLDRPDRLNTMNVPMRRELEACFRRVRADADVRALVVTGAGDAFCAGGDVNDFAERDAEEMHLLMRELSHRWFAELWQLPKPTIAAVNGVAAGGGINMALACDLVVASDRARFGETFVKVGLMPDLGGAFLLPRSVGLHAAKALCLSGEVIDAERAHALGLVHRIVPPDALLAEARTIAGRLAAGPAHAYAAAKAALNRSFERSMEETLAFELYGQSFLFATRDHGERRDAFLGEGLMPGRYYEDFEPGMVLRHEPHRTVTETDNLLFCALSMNPQPLHLDAEFARTTEHGRQVVNGLFTVALVAGLSVNDTTLGTTAGNLAYTEMTHVAPVFIGDTIRSETSVLSKRESRSRPEWGIVEFEHRGYNQHDALVMRIRRLGMIAKRPAA